MRTTLARVRSVLLALLVLIAGTAPLAAADPYAAWHQGRPAESVPLLRERAETGGWAAWFDCGLAAAEAGDRGSAAAWLLEAHRRAPWRREPRQALRVLGADLPATWCERLGGVAWPGTGWTGVLLLAGAGASLGWWLPRRRQAWLPLAAGAAIVVALPGATAAWLDARVPLAAVIRDSALHDSAGVRIATVAAGTLARIEVGDDWQGRVLVRVREARGWLPRADAPASPP